MSLSAGCTVLFSHRQGSPQHLWIALTNPDETSGEFVIVMIRTKRSFTDDTLILHPGEHPFLRHESCVDYGSAMRIAVASVGYSFVPLSI